MTAKKTVASLLAISMLAALGISSATVFADEATTENGNYVVYIDACGNEVFHQVSSTQSDKNSSEIKVIDQTKEVRESLANTKEIQTRANHYDTEYNPVFIGNWGTDAYARHTLGEKSSSGGKKYLTTQGDVTWYNYDGLVAVPYRNGNSTEPEHEGEVDVAKGTSIEVTATDTGDSCEVVISDFGPNQKSSPGNKTIVDLDVDSFEAILGDKSIGRAHCTTVVEVEQYFNE